MTRFLDTVRVTTSDSAVWRICDGCGLLAALPPEVEVCHTCQSATRNEHRQVRREDR